MALYKLSIVDRQGTTLLEQTAPTEAELQQAVVQWARDRYGGMMEDVMQERLGDSYTTAQAYGEIVKVAESLQDGSRIMIVEVAG
jgi:hypothetical protein